MAPSSHRKIDVFDEGEADTLNAPSPSRTTLPAVLGDRTSEDDRVHLLMLAGNDVGHLYTLNYGLTLLGRQDDCNVQIMDGGISRHHALIHYDGQTQSYTLRDLQSSNGTFVNDTRLEGEQILSRGDKIRLGTTTVLRVSFGDELETQYARSMYDAALRDGLTGIYNRRYLDERLKEEVAFAQRHGTALSMLLLDIDHFKRVNDTYGHPAGDTVLRQLTERTGEMIRAEDVLARYGGEEFAVVCRDISEAGAGLLAERLGHLVSREPFHIPDLGLGLDVTISVGVADLTKSGVATAAQLVRTADLALYRAKETGRNRVVCASDLIPPPR